MHETERSGAADTPVRPTRMNPPVRISAGPLMRDRHVRAGRAPRPKPGRRPQNLKDHRRRTLWRRLIQPDRTAGYCCQVVHHDSFEDQRPGHRVLSPIEAPGQLDVIPDRREILSGIAHSVRFTVRVELATDAHRRWRFFFLSESALEEAWNRTPPIDALDAPGPFLCYLTIDGLDRESVGSGCTWAGPLDGRPSFGGPGRAGVMAGLRRLWGEEATYGRDVVLRFLQGQ